jgi:membrane peptidoglycan carboxypeptidase
VLIMVAGIGLVGLTWFSTTVQAPTEFGEPETTTIMYADGKKQLAKLGEQNRTIVPGDKISPVVKQAVMAAEDKNFLEHGGIDVMGIARAAWNNFSGGTKQGGSTITQQYARHAADLTGITYGRKIREAVLASKLEQQLSKDQILGYYLNAIYFGRGGHGVEAAAQTYFGKSVLTPPGQPNALTVEEAAVLAAVIKQPEPDPRTGHQGYDPQINPSEARGRWAYTLNNMVEKGWLTPEARAKAQYPKNVRKFDPKANCATDCGINTPAGNVINYVRQELEAMGITDWKKGGYRIKTTIDPSAQAAAENAARRVKGSPMEKLPTNYMAALVAIDPSNGRVIAYYGGENATGTDFAGMNTEPDGRVTGGHSPGSTFKVYTLAAALKADISFDSYWDATLTKDGSHTISNANRKPACAKSCTLEESTVKSYNVPFYWIAKKLGPDKVVEAARDAGVRTMWGNDSKPVDLVKHDPASVAPQIFDKQVGYGQYPITVLDHANGMATIANRGIYNKAHFIDVVEQRNKVTGQWVKAEGEQLKPKQVFEPAQMDNLNGVLQKIPTSINNALKGGRAATGKTGTWELNEKSRDNGDAWMIGATPQIASAVWVGTRGTRGAIREPSGKPMGGADTPAAVWEKFMEDASAAMKLKMEQFPDRKETGDPDNPVATGVSPAPVAPSPPSCNPLDLFCPNRDNRGNGNGGGPGDGGWVRPSLTPRPG